MPVVAPTSPSNSARIEAVRRSIGLMRDNLCEQLSLTDLARWALFSPFHFHRLFRDTTGMTPARFLAALRMGEARRLLLHTDLTVAAVGSQVGYASAGTFTTQFTRLVGESPARFRQLARRLSGRRAGSTAFSALRPVPGEGGSLLVSLTGAVPRGCVVAGLDPTSEQGCGSWSVRPAGHLLWLPAAAGPHRLRLTVIEAGVSLTDALVDEAAGSRLVAEAPVRYVAGRHVSVLVTLRRPSDLDPPLLAAAPLRYLLEARHCDNVPVRRVS